MASSTTVDVQWAPYTAVVSAELVDLARYERFSKTKIEARLRQTGVESSQVSILDSLQHPGEGSTEADVLKEILDTLVDLNTDVTWAQAFLLLLYGRRDPTRQRWAV